MQIIDRKNIANLNTSLLIKLKHTLLRKVEIAKALPKSQTRMLVDLLSELDIRKAELVNN